MFRFSDVGALGVVAAAISMRHTSAAATASPPQFNDTVCPAFWELQAPHVAATLRQEDMEGVFYELAFHDYTQFPLCPFNPRCITSSKKVQTHADGVRFVNDTWHVVCSDHPYEEELLFNFTGDVGSLVGYWPNPKVPFLPKEFVKGIRFPDTVVDFKPGPQGWLLELQCIAVHDRVLYVGINFYAKVVGEATMREMDAAARARGLGFYMDRGFGMRRVDQSNCSVSDPQFAAAEGGLRREGLLNFVV